MNLDGFAVYQQYLAVSRHFGSKSYNYNKYRGRVNVNHATFLRRRDRGSFHKLGRKLKTLSEVKNFFIANMIEKRQFYPLDILKEESFSCYTMWLKRRRSLNDYFLKDLIYINKLNISLKDLFLSKGGALPIVLQLFIQDKICFETVTLLDKAFKFVEKNSELEDPLFKKYEMKIRKYKTFITCNWDEIAYIIQCQLIK